jgi:hypothetical protein
MVYLAITPAGRAEAMRAAPSPSTVWCGADAISEEAYEAIPVGDRPTRFIYNLGDRFLLDDAVGTIREHHPGQAIWIEAPASTGADAA